jgi:hypothetical protein
MINFEVDSNIEENYINLYDIEEDIHGNSMFDNNGSDDFYDDNQENFASDNINIFFEPTINKEDSTKAEAFSTEKTSNSTDVKDEKEKEKENKIFEITKEPKKIKDSEEIKELKEFKLLGQKRESENHTKFAFDNLVRKIKSKLVSAILIILNKSLQKEEKTEIKTPLKETKKQKKGDIKSECFLKPEQSIMLDTKVKYNLDLLKMTLREIFSKNVSEKVKNYSKEHQLDYNKNFIEKIKDDERKEKTNAILDMTFLQCMEHYRGSKRYDVLSGLEIEYEKDIEQMSDDVEYMENFIEHLKNFEVLYANKKSRNSKKKKTIEEEN